MFSLVKSNQNETMEEFVANHEKMINTVLSKWCRQRSTNNIGGFIRFLDGDTHNCCLENLSRVSLVQALGNPEWVVDWDADLRRNEERLVRANMEHFRTLVGRLINEGFWREYLF